MSLYLIDSKLGYEWKEYNIRIFCNKQISLEQLLDSIKLHTWWLLKTYKPVFFFFKKKKYVNCLALDRFSFLYVDIGFDPY